MKRSSKNVVVSASALLSSASASAEFALVERSINVSEEKQKSNAQNVARRFKAIDTYKSLSDSAINLIMQNSDSATLDELLNFPNAKTSVRIASAATQLSGGKSDNSFTKLLNGAKRASQSDDAPSWETIKMHSAIGADAMFKSYLRVALFFKLIERKDKQSINATIHASDRFVLIAK